MNQIKGILVLIIGIVGLYLTSSVAIGDPDKIVAIVNNSVITRSELDRVIEMMHSQPGFRDTDGADLKKLALDDLIGIKLQMEVAKRLEISLGEKEIDIIIANLAEVNKLTPEQFMKEVINKEKISIKDFRNQLREQATINEVHRRLLERGIRVEDKEVDKVLKAPYAVNFPSVQYRLIDIVFEVVDDISEERLLIVNKIAEELGRRLEKHQSVEDIVDTVKPLLKSNEKIIVNNDMGWRRLNDLPKEFVSGVAKLQKVGQVIGPIKASNGIHILKLNDVNGILHKLTPKQARNIVFVRKMDDEVKKFVKELRDKAYVKIMSL